VHKIKTEELDKRFGPGPAGEMEGALTYRAQANKRIRELRKQKQKKPAVWSGSAEVADTSPQKSGLPSGCISASILGMSFLQVVLLPARRT